MTPGQHRAGVVGHGAVDTAAEVLRAAGTRRRQKGSQAQAQPPTTSSTSLNPPKQIGVTAEPTVAQQQTKCHQSAGCSRSNICDLSRFFTRFVAGSPTPLRLSGFPDSAFRIDPGTRSARPARGSAASRTPSLRSVRDAHLRCAQDSGAVFHPRNARVSCAGEVRRSRGREAPESRERSESCERRSRGSWE